MRKRILLGHLNSNGDCLFATVIARQIKEADHPGCHLTWAVSSRCKQSVELNPFVDEIWEVPIASSTAGVGEWSAFVADAQDRKAKGEFDIIYLTQIFDENWFNYDGGIRSSTYNNYPNQVTVPYQPVIELSYSEVERVKDFAGQHRLETFKKVILVECGADSFETALSPRSAFELASQLTADDPELAFILSSNKKIESETPQIVDASVLSFRENAELSKYCDLFVGCGSGISWLMTTNWAKKLDLILIIKAEHVPFPSMIYDHEYVGLSTNHIIEIQSGTDAIPKLKACLSEIQSGGFARARKSFNEKIFLANYNFLYDQVRTALSKFEFGKAFGCLRRCIRRNGVNFVFSRHFAQLFIHLATAFSKKIIDWRQLRS